MTPAWLVLHHILCVDDLPWSVCDSEMAGGLARQERQVDNSKQFTPVSWSPAMSGLKTPRCDRPSGCEISTSTSPHVALPRRYDPQASAMTPGCMVSATFFT